MKKSIYIVFILMLCFSCKSESDEADEIPNENQDNEIAFDTEKWKTKEGKDYPFRDKMVNGVVYNDTIRTLNKEQLFKLLGEPDYIKEGHLYYRISETRIGSWTVKTKTMVVKLIEDSSIEWIKIHN